MMSYFSADSRTGGMHIIVGMRKHLSLTQLGEIESEMAADEQKIVLVVITGFLPLLVIFFSQSCTSSLHNSKGNKID